MMTTENIGPGLIEDSVGLVEPGYYTFAEPPGDLPLRCGKKIGPVTIAFETYGSLNEKKNNAVLITHALSGTAHAAGYHSIHDRYPGWWDLYIGPGKPFDTNRYFIICSNVIGGCNGSTGPSSKNPVTGRPYGLDFPMITIEDMVRAQWHLIKHLGIEKLLAVAGGSMGGMQALKWTIIYPDMVNSVVAIATSASLSAQGIALNEVGRQAIMNDPNWSGGDYYTSKPPDAGLSLARMIGHITYLSDKHMHEKFGRQFMDSDPSEYDFKTSFMVETYLHQQGIKFVDRFDANSYLYITRAIDFFDLKKDFNGNLINAFENVSANFLVISFTSDWLYPSSQSREIVHALRVNEKNVIYTDIETDRGHDAFLIENPALKKNITNFLMREFEKISSQ
ncbi:MAG: homoserine O-acetyltransferase [Spirochaetes bacterium]|jgi:homoserine O-acetyltransferase|nr:homoserine O-acetyltransferase [Spirochaetota bacterium]